MLLTELDCTGIGALTTVAVTYLTELGLSGTETGIVFLVVLLSTIPGSAFATYLSRKLKSPTLSIKMCSIFFIISNFVAFFMLADKTFRNLVWLFGAIWGFLLGWYFPTEVNIFSSLMPKGQEAELAGFYLYCTQILGWLPPLVFTLFNENPSINIAWAGVQLNIYVFISLLFYHLMPPWGECLKITSEANKMITA